MCDKQRTVKALSTLATTPIAILLYVVVFFASIGALLYGVYVVADALAQSGHTPPLSGAATENTVDVWLLNFAAGFFFIFWLWCCWISFGTIAVVYVCASIFAIFFAWRVLYMWWSINYFLLQQGYFHMALPAAPHQTPHAHAELTAFICVGLLISLTQESIDEYRTEIDVFDNARLPIKQEYFSKQSEGFSFSHLFCLIIWYNESSTCLL